MLHGYTIRHRKTICKTFRDVDVSKAVSSAGSTMSAGMCASACLRSEPSCIGFYYNKVSETCELLDSVKLTEGAQKLSQTWILGNTN